jgi:hypothetical protein
MILDHRSASNQWLVAIQLRELSDLSFVLGPELRSSTPDIDGYRIFAKSRSMLRASSSLHILQALLLASSGMHHVGDLEYPDNVNFGSREASNGIYKPCSWLLGSITYSYEPHLNNCVVELVAIERLPGSNALQGAHLVILSKPRVPKLSMQRGKLPKRL